MQTNVTTVLSQIINGLPNHPGLACQEANRALNALGFHCKVRVKNDGGFLVML